MDGYEVQAPESFEVASLGAMPEKVGQSFRGGNWRVKVFVRYGKLPPAFHSFLLTNI
jgi:hypothetical protein